MNPSEIKWLEDRVETLEREVKRLKEDLKKAYASQGVADDASLPGNHKEDA